MTATPSAPAPPRPWLRPALHAATGLGALLLGVLPHAWALVCGALGVLAGWVAFPLTIEARLRRPGERYLGGLRTYPLAVLGLVAWLPPAEAAAAWGVLALGDVAAAVVGRRVAAPPLLGHPKATWAGSLALLTVGSAAAWLLGTAVAGLGSTVGVVDTGPAPGAARCVLAALGATLVDLAPIPPDDNLPGAAVAGAVLALTRGTP